MRAKKAELWSAFIVCYFENFYKLFVLPPSTGTLIPLM